MSTGLLLFPTISELEAVSNSGVMQGPMEALQQHLRSLLNACPYDPSFVIPRLREGNRAG